MFPDFQWPDKCEWFDAGLAEFVASYNAQNGTTYQRSRCLDVEDRTRKQPEVLIEGRKGERPAVIEQKFVAVDLFPLHCANENNFLAEVTRIAGRYYNDRPYVLTVDAAQFESIPSSKVRGVAENIASRLLDGRLPFPCSSRKPIHWRFGLNEEDDAPIGIAVNFEGPTLSSDILGWAQRREETIAKLSAEAEKQLQNAVLKFTAYDGQQRIVLLKFFNTCLEDDAIPAIMASVRRPDGVDEVWVASKEYVSPEGDYKVIYTRY